MLFLGRIGAVIFSRSPFPSEIAFVFLALLTISQGACKHNPPHAQDDLYQQLSSVFLASTKQRKAVEMINSTYQITFGIEVECVLAFHKSLLQNYLTATKTTSNIIKDIHEDVRRELRQGSRGYRDDATRHIYRGWALTTPTTYPPERDNGFQEHFEKQLSKHGYRAYGGEILHIAQAILPPGVKVFDSFSVKRYTDFSHWHLTHEGGIVGVDKEDLTQRLDKLSITTKAGNNAKLLKQPNMANDWDNHPLELVSRVLPYNFKSCTEMVRYLTALQEGPTHFAFATKHCGLHIHVGLPVPDEYVQIQFVSHSSSG